MPDTTLIAEQLKEQLAGGLIPAVPVMFDRAHQFHERAHASYVDYMQTQPIAGVAVWAHTGRGLHLTKDVARRVIEDWRAGLPNKPLIAGVGADSKHSDPMRATAVTLSMAADAAQYGADAFLAYPPAWLRQNEARDRLIVEHHARLDQLGLPIILFYLYEAAGGISYNANILDELLSLPHVVGIKMATLDSVMTYQDVARHIAARLNVTAADYVFLLDPWWNPAVESQAIDRAHRIGQTRRVFAYRLIAKDTVEEKVLELQQSKRDLADAIINAREARSTLALARALSGRGARTWLCFRRFAHCDGSPTSDGGRRTG